MKELLQKFCARRHGFFISSSFERLYIPGLNEAASEKSWQRQTIQLGYERDLFMRSDTEVRLDILDELMWEPTVDANGIGVTVHNGIVTLTGHVSTYSEKRASE